MSIYKDDNMSECLSGRYMSRCQYVMTIISLYVIISECQDHSTVCINDKTIIHPDDRR